MTALAASLRMPTFYQRSLELREHRSLSSWIGARRPGRALDAGCGAGRWSIELAAGGWNVTGLDLSATALAEARRRADADCVRCQFKDCDLADDRVHGEFDLILSVEVMQHITDHDRAAVALTKLAAALAPGGELVLLETAPTRYESRCDTQQLRVRTFDWYRRVLEEAGLSIVNVIGVDPMPLTTWLLPYYRKLPPFVREIALAVATVISLPLDWLFGPSLPDASWHKVMIATRSA